MKQEKINSVENSDYREAAALILAMEREDQEAILKPREGSEYSDWAEVNEANLIRFKDIVDKIGWPTISKVGKDAASGAWLLVQHSDQDKEFQKYCLHLMLDTRGELDINPGNVEFEIDRVIERGDVEPFEVAYLIDRVLVNSNDKQIFGTQWTPTGSELRPLVDRTEANRLRAKLGMESLEEYEREVHEMQTKLKESK